MRPRSAGTEISRWSFVVGRWSRIGCLTTVANDQGPTTTYQRLKQETYMATIQLRTAIPGPKSKALAQRRTDAIPRGLSIGTPVYVAKAEDAWLEDVDGNRYLDFAGGIGCLNVGHRQEAVVEAVKGQLDKFLHTCIQVTPYESYVRLAERMNEVTPGKFAKKTIFLQSGAEAVENAVKIARAYTKRPGIIAFEDAFHGRTMMTLALTSKTHPYKAGFA